MANLRNRDLISMRDLTAEEIGNVLVTAAKLKHLQKSGQPHALLPGKSLAMIFQKPSTRTRISFELAMFQLGGHALYLNAGDIQLGRGETIADTARVLSRYVDAIMIRTFKQSDVEELAQFGSVPVINGLTDLEHPCQILADLLTIQERKVRLAGLKVAWVGDGNNMANSMMLACARLGMNITLATPEGYDPDPEIVCAAQEYAAPTGASVVLTRDPAVAMTGADVVMTDTWASMGQEGEYDQRIKAFQQYQVNEALVALADQDYVFMHCLPAHRGEEVVDEIMDGPHSVVWDEAENRLHVQKALLALILGAEI
jgi:ornithine carbamoyltransferase